VGGGWGRGVETCECGVWVVNGKNREKERETETDTERDRERERRREVKGD